uniref:Uncharacterized protein n=1 Tax=Helianthus annuus TaxID=4232 RepID=A0A251UAH1_HELAN
MKISLGEDKIFYKRKLFLIKPSNNILICNSIHQLKQFDKLNNLLICKTSCKQFPSIPIQSSKT